VDNGSADLHLRGSLPSRRSGAPPPPRAWGLSGVRNRGLVDARGRHSERIAIHRSLFPAPAPCKRRSLSFAVTRQLHLDAGGGDVSGLGIQGSGRPRCGRLRLDPILAHSQALPDPQLRQGCSRVSLAGREYDRRCCTDARFQRFVRRFHKKHVEDDNERTTA